MEVRKKIPLAGPSITQKEVEAVHDAVVNGWYETYDMHIKKLETVFAQYVGAKFAIATYSGTHALHLAALALELGPGDEVIVTDQSFIATAHALSYVGAKCVFVDIAPETLCIDAAKIEQAVTPQTKAIMVVHFAGFACDMDPIMEIANRFSLRVIEDACQSVGTQYKGRYTGTIGDIGTYSFQGSKIAVGGEGGMLVTNDEAFYRGALHYGTFCRNDSIKFLWSDDIGYNYRISNVTAALILAQIERIDELIENKKRIYMGYYQRLKNMPWFQFLLPPPDCTCNYSYAVGYLCGEAAQYRDQVLDELLALNIHVRPGYPSMSEMPHYERRFPVPNSVRYDQTGIVLPTAHCITEENIEEVCQQLCAAVERRLAGTSDAAYAEQVTSILNQYKRKCSESPLILVPVLDDSKATVGFLRPVTQDFQQTIPECAELFGKWRRDNPTFSPSRFNITTESTARWLTNQIIHNDQRVLFVVQNAAGEDIGHIGYANFRYSSRTAEVDCVLRGVKKVDPRLMEYALRALVLWGKTELKLNHIDLKVLWDNHHAIAFYQRCGFQKGELIPLRRVEVNEEIQWHPCQNPDFEVEKYYLHMTLC